MTQLEAHVAIADHIQASTSGGIDYTSAGLAFYRDPTVVTNPPSAGWVVLDIVWQPERQHSSGSGPTAYFFQVGVATVSVHTPKNLGMGTCNAHAEAIRRLFVGGILAGELVIYSTRIELDRDYDATAHVCMDVLVEFEKRSLWSMATSGYVTYEGGGRLVLE